MRALTPAHGHLRRQVSPLTSPHLPDVPPPTTRCVPTSLSTPAQRVGCVSGFALSQEARHALPAESGSSPADRQFASGCSPPRLATTQLPSATEPWHTPTRTFTVLMRRPRGRTGSGAPAATGRLPATPRQDAASRRDRQGWWECRGCRSNPLLGRRSHGADRAGFLTHLQRSWALKIPWGRSPLVGSARTAHPTGPLPPGRGRTAPLPVGRIPGCPWGPGRRH